MIAKGDNESTLETIGCFKKFMCECVCMCVQKILYLFASQFLFLGKSDYLNPIMHSSLLFLLSLCIPLPPVNQKKAVSQASMKGRIHCFLLSLFTLWDPEILSANLMKFLPCWNYI